MEGTGRPDWGTAMSSRLDAEWILMMGRSKRSMWPAECCDWVAGQLAVEPWESGSCTTWLALVLERRSDTEGTVKRLLAALDTAPEGTMTNEDFTAQQRRERRMLDKWAHDQAEGHGRLEGHGQ